MFSAKELTKVRFHISFYVQENNVAFDTELCWRENVMSGHLREVLKPEN